MTKIDGLLAMLVSIVACGLLYLQDARIEELDRKLRIERAISTMLIDQAAACFVSKRLHINTGGLE